MRKIRNRHTSTCACADLWRFFRAAASSPSSCPSATWSQLCMRVQYQACVRNIPKRPSMASHTSVCPSVCAERAPGRSMRDMCAKHRQRKGARSSRARAKSMRVKISKTGCKMNMISPNWTRWPVGHGRASLICAARRISQNTTMQTFGVSNDSRLA